MSGTTVPRWCRNAKCMRVGLGWAEVVPQCQAAEGWAGVFGNLQPTATVRGRWAGFWEWWSAERGPSGGVSGVLAGPDRMAEKGGWRCEAVVGRAVAFGRGLEGYWLGWTGGRRSEAGGLEGVDRAVRGSALCEAG